MEELEQRGSTERYIRLIGDPLKIMFDLSMPVYGIAFRVERYWLGHSCVLLDLEADTMLATEVGSLIEKGLWKSFSYPQQKEELLIELCNESKRRFEKLADSLISK